MFVKQSRVICILLALVVFSGSGAAQQEEKKHETSASLDGTSGLFRVWDAETMRRSEINASIGLSHYHREPGQLRFTLAPAAVAFGITDRFEVFASAELARRVQARNIGLFRVLASRLPVRATTPLGGTSFNNEAPFIDVPRATGFGDVRLGTKFNLFSERRNDPLSVSFVGFLKFPTANGIAELNRGLGTGEIDGGIGLLASKRTSFAQLHANSMVNWVRSPKLQNVLLADLQHEFWYRAGIGIPVVKSLQAIAEIDGKTYFGDRSLGANPRSPVDVIVGVRLFPNDWLVFGGGYRASLNHIKDDPGARSLAAGTNGFVAQLSLRQRVNMPPTVACAVSNATILQGATTTIRANASDPDGDRLTYSWTSTGGKVAGSAETATFDATGVAPGRYTITATVSDGKHQASCSAEVTVQKRNAAPTVSCAPSTTAITVGETATIRATASDPNNDSLTYTWNVNGARIATEGPTLAFGSTGRQPGTYAIGVTVSDGELTASCTSNVTVRAAVQPNRAPSIECLTTSLDVASGGTVQVQARASDPDGDRTTITWSATPGSVSGSGANATYSAAGVRAGVVTLTATVDDGRGGRASCNVSVNVSERVSLTSEGKKGVCGDFAAGKARVDNCAKGALDDVALRLQNDPRLRGNLIGYSDSSRLDRGTGGKRAAAVADYLKSKGIDTSRLTVTDGGTANSIGDNKTAAGRKQNRRVEIELASR